MKNKNEMLNSTSLEFSENAEFIPLTGKPGILYKNQQSVS